MFDYRNRKSHNVHRLAIVIMFAVIFKKFIKKIIPRKTRINIEEYEKLWRENNTNLEEAKFLLDKLKISLRSRGANHLEIAEEYAYETKMIREIIMDKKEYYGRKIAFLTFDDGPNHKITPRVLDILKEEKVPATFFVIGQLITEDVRDILQRQLREGHGIALHSFSHNYRKLYSRKNRELLTFLNELNQSEEALKKVLGENFKTKVFRYPGGNMTWNGLRTVDELLEEAGIQWIDWNALTGDAQPWKQPLTVSGQMKFLKRTLNRNENHDITVILCHDSESKELTIKALPKIITYLKEEGYTFGILK